MTEKQGHGPPRRLPHVNVTSLLRKAEGDEHGKEKERAHVRVRGLCRPAAEKALHAAYLVRQEIDAAHGRRHVSPITRPPARRGPGAAHTPHVICELPRRRRQCRHGAEARISSKPEHHIEVRPQDRGREAARGRDERRGAVLSRPLPCAGRAAIVNWKIPANR